jgi:tetratricopeptide (TPR) repeat protein
MLQTARQRFSAVLILIVLSILACDIGASHLEKAREAASKGETETAFKEYEEALADEDIKPADKFSALTERADLYLKQDNTEAALADYEAALKLTNEDGSPAGDVNAIYSKRAEIYVKLENWEAVVADLDQVLAGQPQNYEALARRGYAHLQLRNFEQAIADLKASLQGDVAAASADLDSKQNLVEAYYDLGGAMRDLGEYDEAVNYYSEGLNLADDQDDRAEILAARAFVYSELRENEKALTDLDQALALDPNMALAYAYRSYVYSDQENYEAAIADANKAVELGSELEPARLASILHARALAYLYLDQYEQAIADATESIRLAGENAPEAARTYNVRSQANRSLGDYEQAIADASKAIELGSTDVTALSRFYSSRAYAYYFNGDTAAAISDIEAALSIDKDNPSTGDLELLAQIHLDQGEYEAAMKGYQDALAIAPDDAWLHNGLGDAHYGLDDLGSAETEYRAAVRLGPEEALFHENLGLVLRLTERYEEAVLSYTEALNLNDQRPYSWLGRGLAYYGLSQNAEAIPDLETALTFELSPEAVELVNNILVEIKP